MSGASAAPDSARLFGLDQFGALARLDQDIGHAAQDIGLDRSGVVLLDRDGALDFDRDPDLLASVRGQQLGVGHDLDIGHRANRDAVIFNPSTVAEPGHRPFEENVVVREAGGELRSRQPQYRDKGEKQRRHHKSTDGGVMCACLHLAPSRPAQCAGDAAGATGSAGCAARPRGPWKYALIQG